MKSNSLFNIGLNFKLYLIVRVLWVKELCLLHLLKSLNGWVTDNFRINERLGPESAFTTFEILLFAASKTYLPTFSLARNILVVRDQT